MRAPTLVTRLRFDLPRRRAVRPAHRSHRAYLDRRQRRPLLWVLPLSLLLTWVLVHARPLLPHKWMLALQQFAIAGIIFLLAFGGKQLLLTLGGHRWLCSCCLTFLLSMKSSSPVLEFSGVPTAALRSTPDDVGRRAFRSDDSDGSDCRRDRRYERDVSRKNDRRAREVRRDRSLSRVLTWRS